MTKRRNHDDIFKLLPWVLAAPFLGCSTNDDGQVEQEVRPLYDHTYTLAPGEERVDCGLVELTEDLWVQRMQSESNPGFHHNLIKIDTKGVQDPCLPENQIEWAFMQPLYISGVGTQALDFGQGRAIKLPASTRLLWQVHLLNSTSEPITQVSRINGTISQPEDIEAQADLWEIGSFAFSIPKQTSSYTVSQECNVSTDSEIVAVWAYMHEYGKEFKIWIERANGTQEMLKQGPFDFHDQLIFPVSPAVKIAAGDKIRADCTWSNMTDSDKSAGFLFENEMCVFLTYQTPAMGSAPAVVNPNCRVFDANGDLPGGKNPLFPTGP